MASIIAFSDVVSERNRRTFLAPLQHAINNLKIEGLNCEYTLAGWKEDAADIYAAERFKKNSTNGLVIQLEGFEGHIRVLAVSALPFHKKTELFPGPESMPERPLGTALIHSPFPSKGVPEFEVSAFTARTRNGKTHYTRTHFLSTPEMENARRRIEAWAHSRAPKARSARLRLYEPRADEAQRF